MPSTASEDNSGVMMRPLNHGKRGEPTKNAVPVNDADIKTRQRPRPGGCPEAQIQRKRGKVMGMACRPRADPVSVSMISAAERGCAKRLKDKQKNSSRLIFAP